MNLRLTVKVTHAAKEYSEIHTENTKEQKMAASAFLAGVKWALKNQWCPVEDEQPKKQKNVLMLFNGKPFIGQGIFINELKGITHWMSIPKLEKK